MFAGLARRGASWSVRVFGLGALCRRPLTALVCAVAALVFLVPSARAAGAGAAGDERSKLPPGIEDMAARTEYSRTYLRPDGLSVTRVSSEPVNFWDARGSWQPVDNALRVVDG